MKGLFVNTFKQGKSALGKVVTNINLLKKRESDTTDADYVQRIQLLDQSLEHKRELRMSRRRDSVAWERDAENGLSFERLNHQLALKHPRKKDQKAARKFPICGTRTGWYCALKSWRKSDIRPLGLGLTMYFKFLKFFMFIFFLMTLLSLPMVMVYYEGDKFDSFWTLTLKQKLSLFTLGNIG